MVCLIPAVRTAKAKGMWSAFMKNSGAGTAGSTPGGESTFKLWRHFIFTVPPAPEHPRAPPAPPPARTTRPGIPKGTAGPAPCPSYFRIPAGMARLSNLNYTLLCGVPTSELCGVPTSVPCALCAVRCDV